VNPTAAKIAEISQKRTMIFVSLHWAISKWWWIGVIRNTRRPDRLNTTTWMITDRASATNRAPITTSRISVLVITAIAAMAPPSA
jgi:hypothetical protein